MAGRARTPQYVKKESVRLDLDYTIDEEQLARERLTDGIFPLVTNDMNLEALEVLHAYKRQPQIERRFEQLKTDYDVAPVFLKDVARIEAFLCVYYFALLTEALLERELRKGMEREGHGGRCPCIRKAATAAAPRRGVCRCLRADPTPRAHPPRLRSVVMITELSPLQRKLLRILGLPEGIYQ